MLMAVGLLMALGAAVLPASDFPFEPIGPEARVHQYTGYAQDDGWLDMDDAGHTVVTWTSLGDVYARLFDLDGTPRTSEFRVNQMTTGSQNFARTAYRADGGAIAIVWNDWAGLDGNLMGSYARLLDGDGHFLTPEFVVSTNIDGSQFDPVVAMGLDGSFAVAWVDAGPRDGIAGITMRLFRADGTPASGEIRVNEPNSKSQVDPSIAIDRFGRIIVAYTDASGRYGEPRDILVRTFRADGTPLTGELRVNDNTPGLQRWPILAVAGDGRFVVAWQDEGGLDGHGRGIFARLFADPMTPATGDLAIAESPYADQVRPVVACDFVGNFTVAWIDNGAGDQDILVRRFDRTGLALTPAVRVNTLTAGDQGSECVAVNASGELVACTFTHESDVWGRWFRSPLIEQIGPASPGATVELALWLPGNDGLTYQVLAAFAASPGLRMPLGRHLDLNPDLLLSYSILFPSGPEFFAFRGTLNSAGQAVATIRSPPIR
ncbi:MAG: hypothetical protein U1E76_11615 [Planctomycetota bacterium]